MSERKRWIIVRLQTLGLKCLPSLARASVSLEGCSRKRGDFLASSFSISLFYTSFSLLPPVHSTGWPLCLFVLGDGKWVKRDKDAPICHPGIYSGLFFSICSFRLFRDAVVETSNGSFFWCLQIFSFIQLLPPRIGLQPLCAEVTPGSLLGKVSSKTAPGGLVFSPS